MSNAADVQHAIDDVISDGARRGLLHAVAEDAHLDGRTITLDGRRLVNFGSCSYLGLETHPALRDGVVDAVTRYGSQFSSSRAYVSAPAYTRAEAELSALLGRPALIAPSTTMGHLASLPVLVGPQDTLLLDHQVHHSVQTAGTQVRAQGTVTELIPHDNLAVLERRIARASSGSRRVWYACDGLYSMYADYAPLAALEELVSRYPNLWLYVDDAHSFSWRGRHGRGYALEYLGATTLARTVVAGSLNKSFAAAGGAISFPDDEMRRRVFTVGGPLIFSGPVQPPMLGALLASLTLHRTAEVERRQRHLLALIRQFNGLATAAGLPLLALSEAPIRCIGAGTPEIAYNLVGRLRAAGYFADTATFPAVAAKRSGARLTLTAHHTSADVERVVDVLAASLPKALADEGSSVAVLEARFARQLAGRSVNSCPVAVPQQRGHLRLERFDSVDALPPGEWDAMFGARGSFDVAGLRTMEDVFGGGPTDRTASPTDRWSFTYWVVRDERRGGRPVAATFFTTALWKDDMLSSATISAHVERLRAERDDAHFLTSTMLGMGSLLSEGNHLWLDRSADWRGGMRVLLDAARTEEDRVGASAVVLRDLPDGDRELHDLLVAEGFLRIPVYDTWVRELDFVDDAGFLAGLGRKARYHQRRNVLPFEDAFAVDVVQAGGRGTTAADLDQLYGMYRAVHARNLELNVFPLPRRVLDAVLRHPGWELLTLTLLKGGPSRRVAFSCQHVGAEHVQPLFVGLDYDYVQDHHTYQQLLWQAVRSAQRRGARRVLYGMSADLQKSRFGATREKRWAYVQVTDTFNSDVLASLAAAA